MKMNQLKSLLQAMLMREEQENITWLLDKEELKLLVLFDFKWNNKNRITVKSFGEERPAVFGQDESSYAKNRRVEIN